MNTTTGEIDTTNLNVMKNIESTACAGGVKDLVDSGIVKIPEIFVYPPEELPNESDRKGDLGDKIPVIDLKGVHGVTRSATAEEIRNASESWGFFQVVNHGIPQRILDEMIQGVRQFHEQNKEEKMKFISRDQTSHEITYTVGFDSSTTKRGIWKDSLVYNFAEDQLDSKVLPFVCREILVEYLGCMVKLKDLLCELLSEALGLQTDHLKHTGCLNGGSWVGHYYPACPQPDLTLGAMKHSDDSFMTILLQDQTGGLQVLNQNQWRDATPIRGALMVNIGDFLQVMSNGKFKSVLHRVLAKPVGPRISVGVFFNPKFKDHNAKVIGPIDELLSQDDPPIYKKFTLAEYFKIMLSFEHIDGNSVVAQCLEL